MGTEGEGESSSLQTEDNQEIQEGETTAKKARLDQEHYHSSLRLASDKQLAIIAELLVM